MFQLFSTFLFFVLFVAPSESASKPHILFILADDFGWSDVGFHGSKIQTPNIDKLASEGVILNNYYVQPICTPTRGSLLSGLYPIHLGLQHGIVHNGCPYGLPLNLTLLPQKLQQSGYSTHMLGKWHLGFYNWESTPTYRGFDTFYGFYSGAENHYTHIQGHYLDLRDNKNIVDDMNGTYSVHLFTKQAEKIVHLHEPSQPMFMYLAFQNVHSPVQAPQAYIDRYSFIDDPLRRTYAGMVTIMDEAIGNLTNAFKNAGLWDNTLLVFSTDNGGVPKNGGYDYPLRGRKDTLWEGGIRGVSFVHGSPLARRGVKCNGLMHVSDWYPTLVNLAGGSYDKETLDGYDVWDSISLGKPSPRTELLHNIDPLQESDKDDVGFGYQGIGLRVGDMKLLMGVPNISYFIPPEDRPIDYMETTQENKVSIDYVAVALYNVTADPYEKNDLKDKYPDIVKQLQDRVEFYKKTAVPPANKPNDPQAKETAKKNGAWSPWL
ncbi:arylsulfatase B-like [Actinia tenebrosa]|uniref:Arylsulfatase B-like n=1 Tax=Actinia tenebrosa TaxID=6105 RepID=A0A6P8HQF9_ACTTE|nr:arylsulfatase B-like [Actinia tenebrosa]